MFVPAAFSNERADTAGMVDTRRESSSTGSGSTADDVLGGAGRRYCSAVKREREG